MEAILGIRKVDGHLRVAPCIPPAWKGFEAWIQWGAQEVHVVVDNPDGVSTGVVAATLDGAPFDPAHVPLDPSAIGRREVYVRLGASAASPVLRTGGRAA